MKMKEFFTTKTLRHGEMPLTQVGEFVLCVFASLWFKFIV